TFNVDIANGTYFVSATVGDTLAARDLVDFSASEATSGNATISATLGHWFHNGFTVTVNDGTLNVVVQALGGSNNTWVVNGVEIRLASTVQTISITDVTSGGNNTRLANGGTDTYTGTGAAANSLVTVTSTVGTVNGVDASSEYDGIQVMADS